MQAATRRIVSMVKRVIAFEDARPSDDTSHTAVVTNLKALFGAIPALVDAEIVGRRVEHQATLQRRALRRKLLGQARHLIRVGAIATKTTPTLAGSFDGPSFNMPNQNFINMVRSLVGPMQANLDVLMAAGLGSNFPTEFEAGITAFEAASFATGESRTNHIDARSQLTTTTEDCRALVRVLDGLNTARYAQVPERLDAWESASNVYGPVNHGKDNTTPAVTDDATETDIVVEPPTTTLEADAA